MLAEFLDVEQLQSTLGLGTTDNGILVVTIEVTPEPEPKPEPAPAVVPDVHIIGAVIDDASREAIEGATVVRLQSASSELATAENRAFRFDDAKHAPGSLIVSADGYISTQLNVAIGEFAPEAAAANLDGSPGRTTSLSAIVTVRLSQTPLPVPPPVVSVGVTRDIAGHVFIQSLVPVEGAEVLLFSSGFLETVQRPISTVPLPLPLPLPLEETSFPEVGTQYELVVTPFDGDGICLYGVAHGDCPDPNAGPVPNVDGLSNVVLRLEAPSHGIIANNACNASFIPADEDLVLMFDSSIEGDTFEVVVLGPDGTALDVDIEWTGNYLARIVPSEPFVEGDNANDGYKLQVRSVVFSDDFVLYDPTNASSLLTCGFRVGTNATHLPSPEHTLYLATDDSTVEIDAKTVRYFNVDGKRIRTGNFSSSQIVFPHVPGAVSYSIQGKPTVGDDNAWSVVGTRTVGTEWGPDEVLATVNLGTFGLLSEPLGFGNVIDLMVKSIDSDGHVAPYSGSEPRLRLEDTIVPRFRARLGPPAGGPLTQLQPEHWP